MKDLDSLGINKNNKIITISNTNPVFIFDNNSVNDTIEKLVESNHRSLPVVNKHHELVGIVSISDIFDAYLKNEDFNQRISNLMTREVVYCDVNEPIDYVLQKMKISKRGRLPIVMGKKLIGMVGEGDFFKILDPTKFDDEIIENYMTKKPFILNPSNTVLDVLKSMANAKYRRLPIVEKGKLVGYITSTYLLKKFYENNFRKNFVRKTISTIMVKNPFTLKANQKISDVIKLMEEKNISSVLIVDKENKLLGIITERDIINIIY